MHAKLNWCIWGRNAAEVESLRREGGGGEESAFFSEIDAWVH